MSTAIGFMEDQPVTLQAARDRAKAAFVVHLVALATGVPPKEIMQESRARSQAARARWLALYLIHVGFSLPLMRVAAVFGRDRSSVGLAVRRVEDWREISTASLKHPGSMHPNSPTRPCRGNLFVPLPLI